MKKIKNEKTKNPRTGKIILSPFYREESPANYKREDLLQPHNNG